MNEHLDVQTGTHAAQVLDNEAYKEAMKSLREQVITQWKDCPIRDKEGALLLLQLAKLTDKFEAILRGYVSRGEFAKHAIDLDNERNESKARRLIRRVM
jgi:hypothetical protein